MSPCRQCGTNSPPVSMLVLPVQVEYADWLEALPDSLRGTAMAEALEAIADLDLTALAEIKPPRGYGRD